MSEPFKVMRSFKSELKHPESVPWSFVEKHEAQALRNHYQTLKRLNERGGLSPVELWHVVQGRDWSGPLPNGARITTSDAVEWLIREMEALETTS